MPLSHRVERIAEQIREEVSQILLSELADPGVGSITVTRVKVSPDLSFARIYWTAMSNTAERKATAKALDRASAYVRHLLSTRMSLRRSPEVKFTFDHSVAAQDRVEQILQELKQEEEAFVPTVDASVESPLGELDDTAAGREGEPAEAPAKADLPRD